MSFTRYSYLLGFLVIVACEVPHQHGDHAHGDHAHDEHGHDEHDVGAIAEAVVGAIEMERSWVEVDGYLVSPVLDAPEGATRVGGLVTLVTAGVQAPQLEARGIDAEGNEGPWHPLETDWAEQELFVANTDLEFLAHGAQLRIPAESFGAVMAITWAAVIPEVHEPLPVVEEELDGDIGRVRQALRAEYAAAGVISRASWGARAANCSSSDPNKYRIAIHHTVEPASADPAVRMRGIQNYHMNTQRWCDIGYHLLVSIDGRIWEGRPAHLLGTHVGNQNTGNLGISLMGCFQVDGCNGWTPNQPSAAMIDSTVEMVRLSAQIYGITVSSSTVKGHRDHAGASTACPGAHVHAMLGTIRSRASAPAVPPDLRAEYVNQTFPLASQPFDLRPGERASGHLELRNTGHVAWEPGTTFLATTEPRDGASPLAGPDWVSPSRAATINRRVPPGETGRFEFTVQAPLTPGDYPQFFNLVHDGIGWAGDPGQGGPPDAHIQIRVTALDQPPVSYEEDAGMPPPTGSDAGTVMPPVGSDAGTTAPTFPQVDGGVAPAGDGGPGRPVASGCAAASAPADAGFGAFFALLAFAMLLRRRR